MRKNRMRKIMMAIAAVIIFNACAVEAYHSVSGKGCSGDDNCAGGGWEYCHKESGDLRSRGVCKHKDLFPLKEAEFWGIMMVFFLLWQANLGGVAGAGMVLPIAMIFFRFDAKSSIALSLLSICFGSILITSQNV